MQALQAHAMQSLQQVVQSASGVTVHVMGPEHKALDELRAVCDAGQEEAFYVCEVDELVRRVSLWRRLLPRVRPYYAVKCNSSRVVLSTLATLGVGFDCASKCEIEDVLSLGVDAGRIIYAHPTKPNSHLRYALGRGVNLTTFDNEEELFKIRALHPKCKLVLRIRYDSKGAKYCLGVKYGCEVENEAPRLLRTARDLGLAVVGVSFHVGSGCPEDRIFEGAIRAARQVFDVAAGLGITMNLLDLGGGYPGEPDEMPLFVKMADMINAALAEHFPSPDVDIISEPGTYLVHTAFSLASQVHSKREVRTADGDLENVMYYINDGVYSSFHDVKNHREFHGKPLEGAPARGDAERAEPVKSTVWGPTCDGLDKVEADVMLPPLEPGSWLVYSNMGSYTLVLASAFNGMPFPKVHAVVSLETWLLLKERAPFSECHFVPSIASGRTPLGATRTDSPRRLSLADTPRRLSLVDSPRRLSLALQQLGLAQVPMQSSDSANMPNNCRRGSIIDQMDLTNRPVC